jgi:hypothetical protein
MQNFIVQLRNKLLSAADKKRKLTSEAYLKNQFVKSSVGIQETAMGRSTRLNKRDVES